MTDCCKRGTTVQNYNPEREREKKHTSNKDLNYNEAIPSHCTKFYRGKDFTWTINKLSCIITPSPFETKANLACKLVPCTAYKCLPLE